VVPRTFTIKLWPGLALNQLRLMVGNSGLTDQQIGELHRTTPLLFQEGRPVHPDDVAINNGLFLGLCLSSQSQDRERSAVGFRAKENSDLIDLSKTDYYARSAFWEEVHSEEAAYVILHPEKFYLLMSQDSVRIPPNYAAEMTAYDPTSGELRTHYAGFFDPGFGWEAGDGGSSGSRAALEVRAHDVPFAVEHGQNICRLSFERMLATPDRLYGRALGSNYQGQEEALSKHFRRAAEAD
jgi:dCTP deaminase